MSLFLHSHPVSVCKIERHCVGIYLSQLCKLKPTLISISADWRATDTDDQQHWRLVCSCAYALLCYQAMTQRQPVVCSKFHIVLLITIKYLSVFRWWSMDVRSNGHVSVSQRRPRLSPGDHWGCNAGPTR